VAESTVRWFVVREKHCWMAADSADSAKRTGGCLVQMGEVCAIAIYQLAALLRAEK
jgi:hypothetical protein